MDICAIESCPKIVRTRGYCNAHYLRWNRYGDPLLGKPKPTFEQRFWSKVDKSASCWLWTGALFKTGYGAVRLPGETGYAHRVSFELANGDIPESKWIDHKCHVRACVNPDHLRAVTPKQNAENHNGPRSTSKSGIRGVCWDENRGMWFAQVKSGDRNVFYKHFASIQAAEAAVIEARNTYHTHNDLDRQVAA